MMTFIQYTVCIFCIPTGREPTAYPGHQPELDSPITKSQYNSFITTSREAYRPPKELTNRQLQR